MDKIYYFYTLSANDDLNNVRYVGVTCTSLSQRFSLHKYCARHSNKRGLPVHKWMFSKNLEITITNIDSCSESDWEERERYWIKFYRDKGFKLLNLDEGGKGSITAEKRSKSSIERSIEAKRKPIVALLKDGTFYKEYISIAEAAVDLGISNEAICNVLKKISKSAGGYLWIYKDEYDESKDYKYSTNFSSTTVYKFDKKKQLVTVYKSKKEILDEFLIKSYTALYKAIKTRTLYKGFYWGNNPDFSKKSIEKPEYKYSVMENETETLFKSRKELSAFLNVSGPFITGQLNKTNPWNYKNKIIKTI